jgi:hypothetical protein
MQAQEQALAVALAPAQTLKPNSHSTGSRTCRKRNFSNWWPLPASMLMPS